MKENWFRNLKLKKKFLLCMLGLIVVPLMVVGIVLLEYISDVNLEHKYENSIKSLKEAKNSIGMVMDNVIDLKVECFTNSDIQNVLLEKASVKEYISAYKVLEDSTRGLPGYVSICLSNDNDIIMQQKVSLREEPIENLIKASASGKEGFWAIPRKLICSEYSSIKYDEWVWTYYTTIYYYNNINKPIGYLSVSVSEESMQQIYESYADIGSVSNYIINKDGIIISSSDKKEIGKQSGYKDQLFVNHDSADYISLNNGNFACITYSPEYEWYLVSEVPKSDIWLIQRSGYILIGAAILLCLIFAVVFAIIQSRYIVKPIQALSDKMRSLEENGFEAEELNEIGRKDEIGTLENSFIHMSNKLQQTINEVYKAQIFQKEAELQALNAQINPHFLYNTLDSIHWRANRNRDYEVAEQLEALSEVFRYVLGRGQDVITIREEKELLENYIYILKARYGKRLKIEMDIPKDLDSNKIPRLILQPLVENAVLHGLDSKVEGGNIKIVVKKMDKKLQLEVSDDGVGSDEFKIREQMRDEKDNFNVFALQNIVRRLETKYGKGGYSIEYNSKINEGTIVQILIPLETNLSIENGE